MACFSELEVVKASLLDQVQSKGRVGTAGKVSGSGGPLRRCCP